MKWPKKGWGNAGIDGDDYVIQLVWKGTLISGPPAGTFLIDIITRLQASNALLEKRIAQLEGQGKSKNSRRMPGLKPKEEGKPAPAKATPPGAPPGLGPNPDDAHP